MIYLQKPKGIGSLLKSKIKAIKFGKTKKLRSNETSSKELDASPSQSENKERTRDKRRKIEEWFIMGTNFGEIGNFSEAIKCFEHVLKLNLRDYQAWYNKGAAYESLGRYEEAIKCYEIVLRLNPDMEIAKDSKNSLIKKLEEMKLNKEREFNKRRSQRKNHSTSREWMEY